MAVAVKICGIKTPEMAYFCAKSGAQFVGIVCCPQSVRYVDLATAQAIADAATRAHIIPVAVFTDAHAQTIIQFCNDTNITHVQLHGDLSRASLFELPEQIHKIYVNPESPEVMHYLRIDKDFIL